MKTDIQSLIPGKQYSVTVPLNEITDDSLYIGYEGDKSYFKTSDGRYAIVPCSEIQVSHHNRITLNGLFDVRPNEHFISKKDLKTIRELEGLLKEVA